MKLKKNSIICLAGMSQKKNCSCGSAFGLISLIVNTESKFSLGFFQCMVFIDMLDNYKQFHNGGERTFSSILGKNYKLFHHKTLQW